VRRDKHPGFSILGLLICAAILLGSGGCANLSGVREFTKISAETSNYRAITRDFVQTLERRKSYQSPVDPQIMEKRKLLRKRLDDAQQVLVDYMQALRALSANDLAVYNQQLSCLAKSIGKADLADRVDVSQYKAVVNIISRLFTDLYRQNLLKEIIPGVEPYIQKVISELRKIIAEYYLHSLRNERRTMDSFFGDISASGDAKGVTGLGQLASFVKEELVVNLQGKEYAAGKYIEVLAKISEGHKKMAENISAISSKELRDQLLGYKAEIEGLYKAMKGD
jgi:hypothetical protein